jgi:hypothetical protein
MVRIVFAACVWHDTKGPFGLGLIEQEALLSCAVDYPMEGELAWEIRTFVPTSANVPVYAGKPALVMDGLALPDLVGREHVAPHIDRYRMPQVTHGAEL